MRYYHPFPEAIPLLEAGYSRVTHPSATKIYTEAYISVRLACVRRAASVRPEPGSNSLVSLYIHCSMQLISFLTITIRSQLPFDFLVFSDFSCFPISWNFQGFCTCSALFNFQDTVLCFSALSVRCNFYIISCFFLFVK